MVVNTGRFELVKIIKTYAIKYTICVCSFFFFCFTQCLKLIILFTKECIPIAHRFTISDQTGERMGMWSTTYRQKAIHLT